MRLLSLLPLAAVGLQAPMQRAPIQRRQTARAAFSFSEAADSLKLDEASSKAADAAAKASQSFVQSSSKASDAVAASSKATFEAAQSALKVVDSDAVKNALKAGDGAADATAQAIQRLSSVKVDTSAFDKAAQRAAEAAERAAQAGAKSSASISKFEAPDLGKKLSQIDASGINRGFADAGQKISASVDAKTLTTNLDAGMKELGKNLAVDVRVGIKISWRVRGESSRRRPPRHRRDASSMAWRCRFLTALDLASTATSSPCTRLTG